MKTILLVCAQLTALIYPSLGFSADAPPAQCISDYHVNQTHARHNLTAEQLKLLHYYGESGQPQEGWAALASYGDTYATTAVKLVTDPNAAHPGVFGKLLETHWENTNSREIYQTYFYPVAYQHFHQYVEILESGYWPDSDQLINSYLAAARKFNLPEKTAIDAVWMSTALGGLISWAKAIHLSPDRIVPKPNACVTITSLNATGIILEDSGTMILRTIGSVF